MNDADKNEIVKSWFKKAENDLINAEHTMIMEKPPCDTIRLNFPRRIRLRHLSGYAAK